MRLFVWTTRAVVVAATVGLADGSAVAADRPAPAAPPTKAAPADPVTITVVGDQVVITGDPAAVARAYELGRMILAEKGQVYRAFHLQYAKATDVAGVLDEWFNGPAKSQRQTAVNPLLAALAMRGRGGRTPTPPPPPPEPPRIHVVADDSNNALLVRGTALDLIAVQRVLETAIDVAPVGSEAAMKPFVIGPLDYAVATEVVKVLKDVYQQDLDQGTVRGGYRRRGRPMQPLDPSGRPRPVTLTVTADERTNSIIGMAPGQIADGVKKIVGIFEDKAKSDTKSVELVPTAGIDPELLQDVIEAIQARPATTSAQRPGQTSQRSRSTPTPSRR
jgi:type II secretory pathway component GspD/PulD (secretin)